MGQHNQYAHGTKHVQAIPTGAQGLCLANSNFPDTNGTLLLDFQFLHPCQATIHNCMQCSSSYSLQDTMQHFQNSLSNFRRYTITLLPQTITRPHTDNSSFRRTNGRNSSPFKFKGHPCNMNVRTFDRRGSRSVPQHMSSTLSGATFRHSKRYTVSPGWESSVSWWVTVAAKRVSVRMLCPCSVLNSVIVSTQ